MSAPKKPVFRELAVESSSIDADKRTAEFSIASENPVDRWDGIETLRVDDASIMGDRIRAAAPLLLDHDPRKQIGVIDRAWVEGGKLRVQARFSKSQLGSEVFQDVQDGIRRNVSVGYIVHEEERTKGQNGGPDQYLVTKWEPMEASCVSMPADIEVGFGRSQEVDTPQREMSTQPTPTPAPTPAEQVPAARVEISENEKRDLRAQERTRIGEITAICRQADIPADKLDKFIADGTSVDAVRKEAFEAYIQRASSGDRRAVAGPTMDKRDIEKYSIAKAAFEIYQGRLSGLERECDQEMAQRGLTREGGMSFFVPTEIMKGRTLTASSNQQAGYAIPTELRGIIELLRIKTTVIEAGAMVLSGLTSNIDFLRQTDPQVSSHLGETDAAQNSDLAVGRVSLTPHRIVGLSGFSRQINAQSAFAIEPLIRDDISRVQAIAIDRAAFFGKGSAAEPLGIINMPGIKKGVTYGGAATWAKVVQHEADIETANALLGALRYIIDPSTKAKWKTTPKVANYPAFLMDDGGVINGYPSSTSNQLTTGTLADGTAAPHRSFFANWNDLLIGFFDGAQVIVDPYSQKKNDIVEIQMTQYYDIAARHEVSFSVSTDSAAQ